MNDEVPIVHQSAPFSGSEPMDVRGEVYKLLICIVAVGVLIVGRAVSSWQWRCHRGRGAEQKRWRVSKAAFVLYAIDRGIQGGQ